jgi:hypothetical protein
MVPKHLLFEVPKQLPFELVDYLASAVLLAGLSLFFAMLGFGPGLGVLFGGLATTAVNLSYYLWGDRIWSLTLGRVVKE